MREKDKREIRETKAQQLIGWLREMTSIRSSAHAFPCVIAPLINSLIRHRCILIIHLFFSNCSDHYETENPKKKQNKTNKKIK